jgi:hypothetical protein
MKINYDLIKTNLETYQEAKSILPVICEYEREEVSSSVMRNLGLGKFASFCDFLKQSERSGFNPIMGDITWRKLKPLISTHTKNVRLKKFVMNRTQKQFTELLNNIEDFDRLLNGRWVRKPGYTPRGRKTYGRRADVRIEGIDHCAVPLINYIILNDIEVFDNFTGKSDINSFIQQDRLVSFTKWYTTEKLEFDKVPKREIEITRKLIDNFINIMSESHIDPRKLNLDYIVSTLSDKIRKSMIVPNGTIIKCLSDDWIVPRKILSKDVSYSVRGSYIQSGYLKVNVTNDLGCNDYYDYANFEDMAIHREDLLRSLLG